MNTAIFICTYSRDLGYFNQCVRSIKKFATGFSYMAVRVPSPDGHEANRIMESHGLPFNWDVVTEVDQMGKGMVEHMAAVCRADEYCGIADYILHLDSDCIFTEPVTPDDYFVDDKPVLMYATYEWLKSQGHDLSQWQTAVEAAVGGTSDNEFMRRHPAVHCRDCYYETRYAIHTHTGKPYREYILGTKNDFPWTFTEFPTLGEVAWRKLRDRYHWINQETEAFPPHKLLQFWSHSPVDQPQDINNGGQKMHCTPLEVCNKILS